MIIDDSDEEYEVYFNEPEELLDIFGGLEEKNLFLIQQCQEQEHVLEQKKHELIELQAAMDKEIKSLDDSLKEVNERKERILDNKN